MAKNRRRCFLDMSIDGRDAGRIVFELFDDLAPKTTENFLQLCTGQAGTGKKGVPLSYRGSTFHRIIKDFMIQGGDFTDGNGTGGESIYGSMFEDEPFIAKHDQPYLLSMANKGPNTNGSQFFVTMRPTPHLDGKHCVFGKVVSGTEVVSEIEHLKVDGKSRPIADVIIINCGELVRKRQIDPSESEDEKDKKKKKRRHSNSEEEEKENGKEEVQVSTVKAEDLPAEPANQHSFLMRRSKTPEDRKKQRTSERQRNRSRDRSGDRRRSDHRDSRHRGRSNSPWRRRSRERNTRDSGRTRNERIEKTTGVKTKGRGFLRFNRTDRSQTPPHWRREVNRLKTLDDLHTERERLGGSDAVVKPMRGTHADANEDAAASDKPKDVKVESGLSPRRIPEDNSDAEAVDLGHSGDESDNDDALDEAREQAQALKELHNREHEDEKSTEVENQEEERKEREASVAASEKEKSETPEKAKSKSRSRSRSHSRRRSRSRSRSRHNSRSRERKRSPEKRRSPERRRSGDTRREKRRSRSRDRDHHSSSRRDSRRSRSRDNRRRRSPPRSDRRRRRSRSSS